MSDTRTRTAEAFAEYVQALKEWRRSEKTEHTDRAAIERLLKAFAEDAEGKPKVQHEPKRIADKGAPDFKITRAGMIVGYVETKQLGEKLEKVLKSEQIAKYKTLRPNIIVTDYCEFIWIGASGAPKRAVLCTEDDLENRKFTPREDHIEAVAKLLEGFFSTAPEGIDNAQRLALKQANCAWATFMLGPRAPAVDNQSPNRYRTKQEHPQRGPNAFDRDMCWGGRPSAWVGSGRFSA